MPPTETLAPAPATAAAPAPSADHGPLSRQAVLDSKRSIYGYELQLAGAPDAHRDAQLLLEAVTLSSLPALARRTLFIRCFPGRLEMDNLALADVERLVLLVDAPSRMDKDTLALGAMKMREAKRNHWRFAVDHRMLAPGSLHWLAFADFVQLDLSQLPPASIQDIVVRAKRLTNAKLMAIGVDTMERHLLAKQLGFELYQGNWFAQPVIVPGQTLHPAQSAVLQLIQLVRREAEPHQIEALLKREPALSLRLLRFINSASFGLRSEVESFRQAVMILGLRNLLRWACLLMATSSTGVPPAVGHTAVVRGRLMELLAADLLGPEECDHAFVVGMFSLLDTMTGQSLPKVLEGLALPQAVLDPLLFRRGALAPLLELAEACENVDEAAFAQCALKLRLSGHQINMAHLQALAWAEEMME